jgi:prolyl-tRNA synthetase
VEERVRALLAEIQQSLFRRALEFRQANTHRVASYEEFQRAIEEPGGFLEAGWCGDAACEAKIKEDTKATIRVLPLDRPNPQGLSCLRCGKAAAELAVFARAY